MHARDRCSKCTESSGPQSRYSARAREPLPPQYLQAGATASAAPGQPGARKDGPVARTITGDARPSQAAAGREEAPATPPRWTAPGVPLVLRQQGTYLAHVRAHVIPERGGAAATAGAQLLAEMLLQGRRSLSHCPVLDVRSCRPAQALLGQGLLGNVFARSAWLVLSPIKGCQLGPLTKLAQLLSAAEAVAVCDVVTDVSGCDTTRCPSCHERARDVRASDTPALASPAAAPCAECAQARAHAKAAAGKYLAVVTTRADALGVLGAAHAPPEHPLYAAPSDQLAGDACLCCFVACMAVTET